MRWTAAVVAAVLLACGVEPPYEGPDITAPPDARGALRGSVLRADLGSAGVADVLVGFRSAGDYHVVSTGPDGSFSITGLPTVEWRAELQTPDGLVLAPGETGTRVAIVQPDRTIALLPFRITVPSPDTLPPAPLRLR